MSKNITLIAPYTVPVEKNPRSFSARTFIDNKKTYFILKRSFDVAVSILFILFVLSWLTPLLAFLVKLDSNGPVFFRQKRVGRGGISFYCLKFRTMYVNKDCNSQHAQKNDHRITRSGKWLRKSNVDEFPQFINVLLGHMSIVGPRPHMHTDCARFSSTINGYKFRNFVKPGITGLAQVKGYHGLAVSYESIFRRFQWDAFYVRNARFTLDLKIIRQTIAQRFRLISHKDAKRS